jgi:hypothetical protein
MSAADLCGTPAGIRSHRAISEPLCVPCTAAEIAWSERIAFLTPTPNEAQESASLPELAARLRVLTSFGPPNSEGLTGRPRLTALPAVEEAS